MKWDNITEVRSSTVLSDGSMIVPDYQDRCLRRALDHKLHNLRTMLRGDEDITSELDNVVCKLMKLALRTSSWRTAPAPAKWMQCKLLDLLTLTEKAIQRRQKDFIENSFKALEFEKQEIREIREDNIARHIESSYRHIISPTDPKFIDTFSPTKVPSTMFDPEVLGAEPELNSMERTKAWLNVDVDVVPYRKPDINESNSSGDTDSRTSGHKQMKLRHRSGHRSAVKDEIHTTVCLTSSSKTSLNKYKLNREERKKKTSTTRISRKASRNVKNLGKKCSASNEMVRPKRKIKENRCLTMRASKPIPESLIDLCHPELKGQRVTEFKAIDVNVVESNNIVILNKPSPTAVTEESLLLDIIMDDTQETSTLAKNIGIDVEVEAVDTKDKGETSSNDIDINFCTQYEASTDNICSETIFLNDINEPSTSKGIRHNVGMDVQCGPDTLSTYPMLSASTSLAKISPVCATGIKIHDGAIQASRGTDCSTSMLDTDFDNIITPRATSIGIKIKDSDVNICPSIDISNMDQQNTETEKRSPANRYFAVGRRSWSPESNIMIETTKRVSLPIEASDSFVKTEVLELASSTSQTKNSCSEFYANSKCMVSPSLENSSKTASDILLVDIKDRKLVDNGLSMDHSKPKLTCGGLHVHSFKDKQESEDIVYQGKWERCSTAKLPRKKVHNTVIAKKINDVGIRRQKDILKEKRVHSKHDVSIKKPEKKESKLEHRQSRQIRSFKSVKTKQEPQNEMTNFSVMNESINKKISLFQRSIQVAPNVTKVASKIGMSTIISKNVKSTFTAKKPKITASITVAKEDNSPKSNKCYIPMYMRKRKAQVSDISNLNKNINRDENKKGTKKKEVLPLIDDVNDLLQFQKKVTENTYLVFQNERQETSPSIQGENIKNCSSNEESTVPNNSSVKHANSRQSLNSSTCSSPSSIATVRAATTKPAKKIFYTRHSGSSNRSSLNTSESDNSTTNKTKKVIKRWKSAKKSDKDTNNKENIPQTENCSTNETEKLTKTHFVGKSVCIAQLKTDRSPIQSSMSKHKPSNKTNVKIPMPQNSIEKKRSLSASMSRKKPLKLETSSVRHLDPAKKNILDSDHSKCANMVLVLESQEGQPEPKTVTDPDVKPRFNNSCLVSEWIQNLHVLSDEPSVTQSGVRRLVEDLLDFIDKPVTSCSDDDRSSKAEMSDSFCSFKTVTILGNDKEMLNESIALTNTGLADSDLLSFKSMTSVSKGSEYFLADNELNAALVEHAQECATLNPTPVTDIYERKEHNMVQNPRGIANQAFSGFSLNGEITSNQQPDPISLVDSETGSLAGGQTVIRQATSEEVFISGRSSASFQSCLLEEDSVVPNWLFNLISQQHSQVIEEQPQQQQQQQQFIGPLPAPVATVDSEFDVNGNPLEPALIGLAAGAGDGRGIHSDQSQESSGRGTSVSSSDASSSPHSEALLTDPSAFTTQFELMREATTSLVLSTAEFNENDSTEETTRPAAEVNNVLPGPVRQSPPPRTRSNRESDISADISSIDTDVVDSSDD